MIESVDIAICTWNRASALTKTLQHIARLEVPRSVTLTVILVDNNSTDQTSVILSEFQKSVFGRRYQVRPVHESRQGHTSSRNRAIKESTGDLILWTDDDVRVAPDWLKKYLQVVQIQTEIGFWGSQIIPVFENGRPRWITDNWENIKGCFAARDLGDQPLPFHSDRLPYGANFAIRGNLQRANLFNQKLGRKKQFVVGEDELELFRRVLAQGQKGNWLPGAHVEHIILPDRATERYVYDYFVGQGQMLVIKDNPWHEDINKLKSEAKHEYRCYWLKRAWAKSEVWCSHLIRSALAHGQVLAFQQLVDLAAQKDQTQT